MNSRFRAPVTCLLVLGMFACESMAQQEDANPQHVKPGLYTSVDEHSIYLTVGDKEYNVDTGESAYFDGKEFQQLSNKPGFLDWPCGTLEASDRGTLMRYPISELPKGNRVLEVVRRYFEEVRIPEGDPHFLNGEFQGRFSAAEIDALLSSAFWYHSGPPDAPKAALRPKVLIISLYWGTAQAVVDTNFFDALKAFYTGADIPVIFDFREEYEVPVSYFSTRPVLEHVITAFRKSGIRLSPTPMWYGGDHQLLVDPKRLLRLLGLKPLRNLDSDRQRALSKDLETYGFSRKPIFLLLSTGTDHLLADEGDRIQVAEFLGMKHVAVDLSYFTESTHTEVCGLPPPSNALGFLGKQAPGEWLINPAPPRPPETLLPDPPGVEQPISRN